MDCRDLELHEKKFINCDFRNADLREGRCSRVVFDSCDFRGAKFDLANLSGAKLKGCNLAATTGFWGHARVRVSTPLEYDRSRPCTFQRWGAGKWYGDMPGWSHIKKLGDLPLFGVSNIALILLLSYAGIAEWTNDNIDFIREKLQSAASERTQSIVAWLKHVPAPAHFGLLLLAIVGLLVASILYKVFCPEVVKTFYRIQREERYIELLEYDAANYSRLYSRWACALLYIVSACYTAAYLIVRIWEASRFFLFKD
jgi:hypothetical protein